VERDMTTTSAEGKRDVVFAHPQTTVRSMTTSSVAVVTKVQVEDASLSCCASAEGCRMFSFLCRSCISDQGRKKLEDEVSMTPLKKREESRERREGVWVQQRDGVSMGKSDE
jgi:hypothetical protein